MALFGEVFNKTAVYGMLFINVKGVLLYPNLDELEKNDPALFERWKYLSQSKYGMMVNKAVTGAEGENVYQKKAILYPEYCKIVAITYATLYAEDGKLKRFIKKIVNDDEVFVIETFMNVLHEISSDGNQSTPQVYPTLCGHNILAHDIPFLIKRYIVNRDKMSDDLTLPYLLKRALDIKPWESGIVDTVNVWKFNGFTHTPLMLIADFMGLKKKTDLLPHEELSQYYWNNIKNDPEKTMQFIELQSGTQTNLVIQLMNKLRLL